MTHKPTHTRNTKLKANPTSPGRRTVLMIRSEGLYKGRPQRGLVEGLAKKSGRNNHGHITCRHKGGGHKRLYRTIDFKRDKFDINTGVGLEGKVERFEYDPNRTAHLALILYPDGERRYIIAPEGLKEGDSVLSSLTRGDTAPRTGDCLPLEQIPLSTMIHNVELRPGKGAQLARSAGASVTLMACEGDYATVKLRSGEIRKILKTCRAVIGKVSNGDHNLESLGKAGASRHRGIRPTVRGVAMNPVDHPLGGGEGKTSGGRHPVSPWGVLAKGFKTRNNKRTAKFIIRRKKKK